MTEAGISPPAPRPINWFARIGASIIVLGLIAIIIGVVTKPSTPTTSPLGKVVAPSTLQVGDTVPHTPILHELIGSSSNSITTLSGNHPTVINFFASFCTACAAEMKTFGSVAHREHGVVFVGVDTNEPSIRTARSLIERSGVTYPVLEDTSTLTLATAFGIANLPTTFFVNAKGKIMAEVLGLESATQLRNNIQKI